MWPPPCAETTGLPPRRTHCCVRRRWISGPARKTAKAFTVGRWSAPSPSTPTSVAVIGVAAKWGATVAAIVVPRAGAQPTTEAIVGHGVTLIASYKKPRHLVFVDAPPPLQSGEVDKIGLRKQIAKAANEKQGEAS